MLKRMRKALLVGIDNYPSSPLHGCVNDAQLMENILSRNDDGGPNFSCLTLLNKDAGKPNLKSQLAELFKHKVDIALFYFAGHGGANEHNAYFVTPDANSFDDGINMTEIIQFANASPASEIVILLDCCFSGAIGESPFSRQLSILREGVSIIAACRPNEFSNETNGQGVFTKLLFDALNGGAGDVLGHVTVAGAYAYVEQLLSPWEQRPIFKSHVAKSQSLRECKPALDHSTLRKMIDYFPEAVYEYPLDPSYEPSSDAHIPENGAILEIFQKYRAARLLEPIGEEHIYYAAINSKACRLTPLGQFYWEKARKGLL